MSVQTKIILDKHGAATNAGFAANLAVSPAADHPFGADQSKYWSVSVLRFAANEEIYAEGDDTDAFYNLVSGVVRTCRFPSDGRRQIDAFYVAGELFGIELGGERQFAAEAVGDCTVMCYRRRGPAMDEAAVPPQLFSYAMRSLAKAREHAMVLGRRSATEKVAAFLIEWARHSPNRSEITLAMTRNDIADYLGLTFETVSRTLWQLERDELIELPSPRQIRLKDIEGLEDLNA